MAVDVDSPDREGTIDFKLDGKKLAVTLATTSGTYTTTGEWSEGKLTFSIEYQNLVIAFSGEAEPDGTLAGTMDYGRGPFNWRAERVKDKSERPWA